jgi:hypothetical protein
LLRDDDDVVVYTSVGLEMCWKQAAQAIGINFVWVYDQGNFL